MVPAALYAAGWLIPGAAPLPGLFAEVARTGLHGANRLASNSLLEGAVFGARAARKSLEDLSDIESLHLCSPGVVRDSGDEQW